MTLGIVHNFVYVYLRLNSHVLSNPFLLSSPSMSSFFILPSSRLLSHESQHCAAE